MIHKSYRIPRYITDRQNYIGFAYRIYICTYNYITVSNPKSLRRRLYFYCSQKILRGDWAPHPALPTRRPRKILQICNVLEKPNTTTLFFWVESTKFNLSESSNYARKTRVSYFSQASYFPQKLLFWSRLTSRIVREDSVENWNDILSEVAASTFPKV